MTAVCKPGNESGQLRQLYQSTPAMLHSLDADGLIRDVSDRWLSTLGYRRAEVLGRAPTSFLTASSGNRFYISQQTLLADGCCTDVPCQMVCKTGEIIDVLMSATLERDSAGKPVRSLTVLQDVTQRILTEQALIDERARLASIIAGTDAGTWELNVQTGETRFNERWAHIIGYSLSELGSTTQQTWLDRIHPDDLSRAVQLIADHVTGENDGYHCEVRMRHRDGHWVWTYDRGRVLSWTHDGKPEWMFGTHLDITARKMQQEALLKSEQLLNRTGAVAGVGGWELDLESRVLVWSEQTCSIHGVAPDYEPKLDEAISFYAPQARPVIQGLVENAIATGQGWDIELPFIQANGQAIWVRAVGTAEFEAGKAVRLLGTFQDITEMHELGLKLAEQHELLRVTLQSIGDAVITTDARGVVTWLNPVAEKMTGWANINACGRPITQVFHIVNEQTRQITDNPVVACLERENVVAQGGHTILISHNGHEYGIQDSAAPIRNEGGDLLGVVLVFRDVSEQRRLSGEMSYRATHDAMTGLVNRVEFETRLDRALTAVHETDSEHALLFIDLDQFKLVNDACGHSVGDQLLRQFGKLLSETVRSRDTAARLGGDEFALILEHCSGEQSVRVAQKLCERMNDFRFFHEGRSFRIGTSIGVVPIDRRWGTTSALVQAADSSCYAAKDAGRNRVHQWFDTDQAILERHGEMHWASRLEQALDENRFVLYAQQIEALSEATGGLHAEVLLRMVDCDGTLVQPGSFLPAAERFHLASRIDQWVLRRTIERMLALTDVSVIDTLCVNLSGLSIGDRSFHRLSIAMLSEAGPAVCQRLCLEITETAAITNMADACAYIDQVRALGVRIALDDFGAGASSFGYLKNLSIDLLKIDGQFVRDLIDDPLADVAVRCFVDVAKVMGIKTVAEFVDRPEILARVRHIGVDYAQGFLLHRPEPVEALLARTDSVCPVDALSI